MIDSQENLASETHRCPSCKGPLERRSGMFYWRGVTFHGLVCVSCPALWDDPSDSFWCHVTGTPIRLTPHVL